MTFHLPLIQITLPTKTVGNNNVDCCVIQRRLGKDSNQTLFWHSDQKISQWNQRWTLCTAPAQSFITQLTSSRLYCSVTFHHTHTDRVAASFTHKHHSTICIWFILTHQTYSHDSIICKIHTYPLTKCLATHSHTHTHWAPCLSEAVAVGLWSSEARMVRTVAVLVQDREREVTALYSTLTQFSV